MSKIASKILQNKELNELRDLLSPYTTRAFLVGGCVRDWLLGRESYDYDVEIYDVLPDIFDNLMQKNGANCVGKSYFIYKFKNYDLGLPRTENKIGQRHQDFEVGYTNSPKIASMRRDFTINSIMINIFSGEVVDFWGGQNDLKNGILRHIDDEKFCEDALRVLRGVQFASRLNFSIAPKTLELMKRLNLEYLSVDRIAAELVKFMRAPHLDIGLKYLHKIGLFKRYFGINFSDDEAKGFTLALKNARKFMMDERLFLYLLAQNFDVDIEKIVINLRLPKSFLSVIKEPKFMGLPSDFELMRIALKMPLKIWLGSYDKARIERAKELKIYEKKFEPKIDAREIVSLGFSGAQIGKEIEQRQNLAINQYLKGL